MLFEYLNYKLEQIYQENPNLSDEEVFKLYHENIETKFSDNGYGLILPDFVVKEILPLALEGKIPLVLNEYDIIAGLDIDFSHRRKNPFQALSDLISIHKTRIMPENDTIYTMEATGFEIPIVFIDPSTNIEHHTSYNCGNDTIHTTLNCPVSNHRVGNDWDSCEYATAALLSLLNLATLLDLKGEDSFFDGNLVFENPYFAFCPLGERDKMKKKNPKAIVIEYSNISLNQAINALISYCGLKVKEFGTFGWEKDSEYLPDSPDQKYLTQLIEKEGLPCIPGKLHSETKYMARRMWKREYNAIIALLEYNHQNKIEMPDDVLLSVLKFNNAYSLPGYVPSTIELYKEYVIPILEKHGYKVPNDLFEGITEDKTIKYNDSTYNPYFQAMLPLLPEKGCPDWETSIRGRVISMIKEQLKNKTYPDGSNKPDTDEYVEPEPEN